MFQTQVDNKNTFLQGLFILHLCVDLKTVGYNESRKHHC